MDQLKSGEGEDPTPQKMYMHKTERENKEIKRVFFRGGGYITSLELILPPPPYMFFLFGFFGGGLGGGILPRPGHFIELRI